MESLLDKDMKRMGICLGAIAVLVLFTVSYLLAGDWQEAIEERHWSFPRDHGAHPQYRTEWWYFTGNLTDKKSSRFGYQLTFFRHALQKDLKKNDNPWKIRDLYFAHFALSDIENKRFWFTEKACRKGPGLAGSLTDTMHVFCLDWSAIMKRNTILISSDEAGMHLNIALVPRKPSVFHGAKGLSKKGPLTGQASYYYSFTDLKTSGQIQTPGAKAPLDVHGISWFDHEFGSNQLSAQQAGWDWFSVHLSDGRDLMLYFIRRKDGTLEKASSGTLVEKNGAVRHLQLAEIRSDIAGHWKSPKSKARYPNKWMIKIPSCRIDLKVETTIPDQELRTANSVGLVYYEGAIAGSGTSAGKPVLCEGYVEMTGYAGEIGGIF